MRAGDQWSTSPERRKRAVLVSAVLTFGLLFLILVLRSRGLWPSFLPAQLVVPVVVAVMLYGFMRR